ncbi:hypothetical protein J6590_087888 [Homalodisca vitripennis]|nr:hypothetical protein J6590_087888 [Homalodisca vitripennis]
MVNVANCKVNIYKPWNTNSAQDEMKLKMPQRQRKRITIRIRGRTTASQLDVCTLSSTLQHCSPSLKPTGSGTYHRRHLDQLIYLSRTNKQCPRTASS